MVIAFTGKPGSGKTLSAVRYIYKDKRKNVYTNVKLEIPGKKIVEILPSNVQDLKTLRDGIVFIDEANFLFVPFLESYSEGSDSILGYAS